MRKILLWAGMSPLEILSNDEVLLKNRIGSNSGNLLFQASMYRVMLTEDAEIHLIYAPIGAISESRIEQINAEYECFVLPLANAFRANYPLGVITALLRRLKIPCVVAGIGLQADSPSEVSKGYAFDGTVRAFVDTVLDRSAMLGLRGEITADYLARLGYHPERHFTVIGCPSMFLRGSALPVPRPPVWDQSLRLSLNTNSSQPASFHRLIRRAVADYPEHSLVMQSRQELCMLSFGIPNLEPTLPHPLLRSYYPRTLLNAQVRANRVIGFSNARGWLQFAASQGFSFGSRIHGNIAAVLAGTPTLVLAKDTRILELCRYFQIPVATEGEVRKVRCMEDLVQRVDFLNTVKAYPKNFAHFVDFLNANGLHTIYSPEEVGKEVLFDREWEALGEAQPVRAQSFRLERARQGMCVYQTMINRARKKPALRQALMGIFGNERPCAPARGIARWRTWPL